MNQQREAKCTRVMLMDDGGDGWCGRWAWMRPAYIMFPSCQSAVLIFLSFSFGASWHNCNYIFLQLRSRNKTMVFFHSYYSDWKSLFSGWMCVCAYVCLYVCVCVLSINRERNGSGLGMLSSPEKQTPPLLCPSLFLCLSMGDRTEMMGRERGRQDTGTREEDAIREDERTGKRGLELSER